MKKRFTEAQIVGFLREADAGVAIKDLCRKHGFSEASYYLCRRKSGGPSVTRRAPDFARRQDRSRRADRRTRRLTCAVLAFAATLEPSTKACKVSSAISVQMIKRLTPFSVGVEWRRGWDSTPTRPFRICNLQKLSCRDYHECRRCRRALPAIARRHAPRSAFSARTLERPAPYDPRWHGARDVAPF